MCALLLCLECSFRVKTLKANHLSISLCEGGCLKVRNKTSNSCYMFSLVHCVKGTITYRRYVISLFLRGLLHWPENALVAWSSPSFFSFLSRVFVLFVDVQGSGVLNGRFFKNGLKYSQSSNPVHPFLFFRKYHIIMDQKPLNIFRYIYGCLVFIKYKWILGNANILKSFYFKHRLGRCYFISITPRETFQK